MDVSALRPLLSLLRRGLLDDGDAEEVFSLLLPLMKADAGAIVQADLPRPNAAPWNYWRDVPKAWIDYHAAHREEDPSIATLMRSPPGTFYLGQSTIDEATRRSDFIRSFERASLHDIALAKLYSPLRDDLYFAIYRAKGRTSFDEDDRNVLELLYPHLAGAFAARRSLGVIGATPAVPILGAVEVGFPACKLEMSRRTRAMFERRLGPMNGAGWSRLEKMFVAATRRFTSADVGGRSQRLVAGIRVELAVLEPRAGETSRVRGVLIDEDHSHPVAPPLDGPPRSPAEGMLSERQLAVARLAAAGASIAVIADDQRIRPETARTHLREVYRKLGVNSRAALARALSAT